MHGVVAAVRRRPWRTLRAAIQLPLLAALILGSALPAAAADPQTSVAPPQQRVENVIAAARQYLGLPYRVGTQGPLTFDCSGLVFRAFSDAGLVDRIGGARLRAAGYMRWFAARGLMTADESQAQRGDLVVYGGGRHIGVYLGNGRTISALTSGVAVHSLNGLDLPLTGFLRPDWSGNGKVAPFVPRELPDVAEAPAQLVPAADWLPRLDAIDPIERDGVEVFAMRTPTSRTFANRDGTYTTEFHAQPIFYQPPDATDLEPIDLRFHAHPRHATATVTRSAVALTARPANEAAGFVTAVSGELSVSLGVARQAGMARSRAKPLVSADGRAVDYFDWQPGGIGLRLVALDDGFKSFVVLPERPRRNALAFVLDTGDLTPVVQPDGSVGLVDVDGNLRGRVPPPLLLDSSAEDGSGGAYFSGRTTLSVEPLDDGRWLLRVSIQRRDLDELVYPAYVDLSLVDFPAPAAGAQLAFISSAHADAPAVDYRRPEMAALDELLLGRVPGSREENEVYLRFRELAATLGTVDVASAQLELLAYGQKGRRADALVKPISAEWDASSLTWASRPPAAQGGLAWQMKQAGWSSLDVSDYVAQTLSQGAADFGLLIAGAPDSGPTWQRLAGSDDGMGGDYGPRLVVTWSGLRPAAQTPAPGVQQQAADAARLTWTLPAVAGQQRQFQVQISHDGFATTDLDTGPVKDAAGSEAAFSVPGGALVVPATYEWRVRVRLTGLEGWSAWSAAVPLRGGPQLDQPVARKLAQLPID